MASRTVVGAAARPSPATRGTLKGDTPATDRARLADVWEIEALLREAIEHFEGRLPVPAIDAALERVVTLRADLALSAEGIPGQNPDLGSAAIGTDAAAHAEALADIARTLRNWGSVALFGEADRLDGIAQALAAEAALATPSDDATASTPAEWTPDAERVQAAIEAGWQISELMGLVIDALPNDTDMVAPLSMAVRVRDLAEAQMALLGNGSDSTDGLHRKVYGVFPERKGAAS